MTIKEKIENNPIIWFLSSLLCGFLAGLTAYKTIIEIAHLQVVPQGQCEMKNNTNAADTTDAKDNFQSDIAMRHYDIESLAPQIIPELNIMVAYLGDTYGYDKVNQSVKLFISYPKVKNAKITQENFHSLPLDSRDVWLIPNKDVFFYLGENGEFKARLKEIYFDSNGEVGHFNVDIGRTLGGK